ncbi:MAG TPA: glycosyltransferase [Nakamurella sp.]|nr:glycosyltransferase [Nakamurella sp.]
MRVLFSTTANEGHFGPLLPFVRACAASGHDVRVAAPVSFGPALARVGLRHEPFADARPELIGPVMAQLPAMDVEDANDVVMREVFGRIDAQAALPALQTTVERWRPQVIVRESAEFASLAAAERAGVPHVHVCPGMHEVAARFAAAVEDPLEELGRIAGVGSGRLNAALAAEPIFGLVPEVLDYASGSRPPAVDAIQRFHQPDDVTAGQRQREWGDPDLPLVYVTFGSVAGSIPTFAGVFRQALDALAGLDATVVMTLGRNLDPHDVGPVPANTHVAQWLPQAEVLAHAAVMVGHGGFGTMVGALAAGVPQVVVPLFTFDQLVNGDRVAAVGAGVTMGVWQGTVGRIADEITRLLGDPSFAESARRIAVALNELPPPSKAVPVLAGLVA